MNQKFMAIATLLMLPMVVLPLAILTRKPAAAREETGGLKGLSAGNARVVAGHPMHPNQSTERRNEIAKKQKPFAIVVGCADSRVPPEMIFDQGLGDLFVVRVAGNVLDEAALGSIEYAVEHLGVPLIIVLGHERCGAVDAALKGGETPGHIHRLVAAIEPVVAQIRDAPGDPLDNAVRAQVLRVVGQLSACEPILAHAVHAGKLTVVGARYDLDTGAVEFLGKSPTAGHDAGHGPE